MLEKLFEKYMQPLVTFVRKNCPEPVKTVDNNLVCSLMRVMDCFFAQYFPTEIKPRCSVEEMEDLENMLEPLLIYSMIWSIGATTTTEGRKKFDAKLKELMGKENKHKFPNNEFCYNFMYKQDTKEWINWNNVSSVSY